MKKRGIGGFSSILVSVPCIVVFFVFTVAASIFQQVVIASFCLFVLLIGGLSRLWGELSVRKVSVEIFANSKHMFIGDEAEVSFRIQNEKLLPLIWLELLLHMPRRECFMPDEDFETIEVAMNEVDAWNDGKALKKRFAFIMGRDTLTWSGRWSARRRGIYQVDSLVIRAGDGFGLAQSQTATQLIEIPTFVVYPRIYNVDITQFLVMQWDGTGGERGFIDDLTVMRGLRQYETGDSWKHINWRMAARQQGMNINLYETVTPKAIHFILDGESFCNPTDDDSELEEIISLLASILMRLTDAKVLCGLSVPRSKHMPHTDILATTETAELLTLLANYDILSERDPEAENEDIRKVVFLPSTFEIRSLLRAMQNAGRTYYIAKNAEGLKARGFPHGIDKTKTILITYDEISDEDVYALDVKCINLRF